MEKIQDDRNVCRNFGRQSNSMNIFSHGWSPDDNTRRLAEAEAKLSEALARTRALDLKIAERIATSRLLFQSVNRGGQASSQ